MGIETVEDVVCFIVREGCAAARSTLLGIPGMTSTSLASLQVLLSDMVKVHVVKEDRRRDVFTLVAAEDEIRRRLAPRLSMRIRRL